MKRFKTLFLFLLLAPLTASADTVFENTMRSSGKINVVVGVIAIILVGIFVYLFSLDRKLRKLEEQNRNKQS